MTTNGPWTLADYLALTGGGRFYWLRPRSIRARVKWWVVGRRHA